MGSIAPSSTPNVTRRAESQLWHARVFAMWPSPDEPEPLNTKARSIQVSSSKSALVRFAALAAQGPA